MNSDWHLLADFLGRHRGNPLGLVSLVAREGSSYRQPGARMLVLPDGRHAGSLSGGCLEAGLARIAGEVLADGRCRIERVDTRPHFGCPGVLEFVIERLQPGGIQDEILALMHRRETFRVLTSAQGSRLGNFQGEGFVETVGPRPRLVVVGWTEDQSPLFAMARVLGWETHRIVRDHRTEVGRVADETVHIMAPEELARKFPPDRTTAVLVMSHHLATDLAYLKAAAAGNFGYVGLLGSRRRREELLGELGDCGLFEEADWVARFHAPMGLDLGADNPPVIALSILAEIQAVFAGRDAGFLRDRTGPVHLPRPGP